MGITFLLQKTNTKIQNEKLFLFCFPAKTKEGLAPFTVKSHVSKNTKHATPQKQDRASFENPLSQIFCCTAVKRSLFLKTQIKIQKSFLLPVFIVATPSKEPLRGFRRNVHSSHSSAFLFLNPDHILSSDDE